MNVIYKSPERGRSIQERYRALLQHWPVANRQRMLPTCEGETFAVTCGAESGPDVVLLHGAMANAATWMREVPVWASEVRLRCLPAGRHHPGDQSREILDFLRRTAQVAER